MEEHEIAEVWKAQILATLYERRPRKQDFTVSDLEKVTQVGPVREPDEFFDDLIDWLIEEELIRVSPSHRLGGQALDVQLSAKAQGQMQKAEAGLLGKAVGHASSAGASLLGKATSAAFDFATAVLRARYGLEP